MKRLIGIISIMLAACGGDSTVNLSQNRQLIHDVGFAKEFDYNENPPYGANPSVFYNGWTVAARGSYPVKTYEQSYGLVSTSIDTRKFPYQDFVASGPHIAYEHRLGYSPEPILTGVSWDVSVQVLGYEGTGVGQLTFFSYITDGKSTFAWVINLWDNRSGVFKPVAMQDREVAFVTEGAGFGRYHSAEPSRGNSSPYGSVKYQIDLDISHLKSIVSDLNIYCKTSDICQSFSTNLEDYKITGYGVLHEVFLLGDRNKFVNMQTKFGDIKMYKTLE